MRRAWGGLRGSSSQPFNLLHDRRQRDPLQVTGLAQRDVPGEGRAEHRIGQRREAGTDQQIERPRNVEQPEDRRVGQVACYRCSLDRPSRSPERHRHVRAEEDDGGDGGRARERDERPGFGPEAGDDDHLQAIISRDGVIGTALDAWMLQPGWIRGETTNENLTLEAVADHIDHVCQLAGNALHAAIGSDLDGGYGTEQTPRDLDTIADLQKIPSLLKKKGYSLKDITCIMHGNWVRFFREAWS